MSPSTRAPFFFAHAVLFTIHSDRPGDGAVDVFGISNFVVVLRSVPTFLLLPCCLSAAALNGKRL